MVKKKTKKTKAMNILISQDWTPGQFGDTVFSIIHHTVPVHDIMAWTANLFCNDEWYFYHTVVLR